MRTFLSRGTRVGLAAVAALALTVSVVDARVGGGRNSGSRGSQTHQAPSGTNLAPQGGQTVNRSVTQPGQQTLQRQAAPGAAAAAPSRFGFGSGLFAGLLGAGLIGMLMGGGFMSGLSGLGSMLGLLLQVALIGGLVYLAVRFFRRRAQPAYQNAPGDGLARTSSEQGPRQGLGNLGGGFGGFGGGAAPAQPQQFTQPLEIGEGDYSTFERLLGEVQTALSREDVGTIRRVSTPEMASYIEEDISENQRKGLVNEVTGVQFLDGDLSEAWREPDAEYATVAMRFRLADVTREKATGRIVDGSTTPSEITEIWTFRREPGDDWKLSAIQQPA